MLATALLETARETGDADLMMQQGKEVERRQLIENAMSSVDPACTYTGDADPLSRTNPTAVDSDGVIPTIHASRLAPVSPS